MDCCDYAIDAATFKSYRKDFYENVIIKERNIYMVKKSVVYFRDVWKEEFTRQDDVFFFSFVHPNNYSSTVFFCLFVVFFVMKTFFSSSLRKKKDK